MAKTASMSLIELMSLTQDIDNILEYLGKKGSFQFQVKKDDSAKNLSSNQNEAYNPDKDIFDSLQKVRVFLGIPDLDLEVLSCGRANDTDRDEVKKLVSNVESLSERFNKAFEDSKRVENAYKEAESFSNLQVSYEEFEHLSFLSLRIGKIPSENIQDLRRALGQNAIIITLGNDASKIMAATSKKYRFALDTELKRYGFVNMEVPKDFKGIPSDVLKSLEEQKKECAENLANLEKEKANFAQTHEETLKRLICVFAVSSQIFEIKSNLEATKMVYRITGWIPSIEVNSYMKEIDELTEGRTAIREYLPTEVSSIISGQEQVPVKLKHGKFVSSFERMIFSYGSPLYGTIDPTPFVAVFFTILFGIMFGDSGQGLIFLLLGILMAKKIIKVGAWNKFAPIFIAIGISSTIMGLVTGEFFATESVLEPFSLWITGLFGSPRSPILKVMPSSDPSSVYIIFGIFGVTIAIGFVINTIGLIINIVNKIIRKKYGSAFFGKNGLSGALFFWYVVIFAIRIAAFKHTPEIFDWVVIGVTLFFASFSEPFERLLDGERPIIENGFGSLFIGGLVELIEVISTYLSSSISFVRVGAFALAHAVLGFIISMMAEKCGSVGGLFVLIIGNAIVVVLEGMIVAIQVIRLQYYEFFSKFFSETGSEFSPFRFYYKR